MKASAARLIATLQAWPWLATLRMLAHRFGDERLALTAGGLTFTTTISLVPLVTVMLALFSAFPMFATMEEALQSYFLQALVPDAIARPVLRAINQFSSRASQLGIVGLVALVVSALAMMLTIDRALNAIWRVRRPRPIAQRVLVYWSAVTLGPLLAAASLAGTSYAVSASRGFVGSMPSGMGVLVWTAEFVLHVVGVAALFRFVPNTRVRWRHALAGGLFVAVGMAVAKRLMTFYFAAVPSFSMIYGAFATLPIFLVWIYLGWVIVLGGAVIAAYAPLLGRHLSRWSDAPGVQFHIALALVGALDSARAGGRHGLTGEQLAAAVGTDPLQSDPVLEHLVALDWVGRLAESGNARHVLLCDPATTRAEPLIARLLIEPQPDLAALWQRAGFAEMTLAEIAVR